MAFGTWRSPFPFQFGGGSTRRVTRIYDRIHANLGDAITQSDSSTADVQTKAEARCLATCDRAIDRRIVQSDPRKMGPALLDRWEAFYGIAASVNDPLWFRRQRLAARMLTYYDGGSGSVSSIAETAFAPWSYNVRYGDVASATTLWAKSSPADATRWYSTVAMICIEYIRPVNATDQDVQRRVDAARAALDEYLPAWTTFGFSETIDGDDFGFMIGVSPLGHTALKAG